jgi:hypothetical protein
MAVNSLTWRWHSLQRISSCSFTGIGRTAPERTECQLRLARPETQDAILDALDELFEKLDGHAAASH